MHEPKGGGANGSDDTFHAQHFVDVGRASEAWASRASRKAPWGRSTQNLSLGVIIEIAREKHMMEIKNQVGLSDRNGEKKPKHLAECFEQRNLQNTRY